MTPPPAGSSPREPRGPRVYYLTPDYPVPSWGQGLLYEHVRLLREEGLDSWVLHERAPFRLPWLDSDVPVAYLDAGGPAAGPEDLLVVPETLVAKASRQRWPGRRGVFVQGSFLTLTEHAEAFRYPELGFEFALAVLPHVAEVVAKHFGIAAQVVPPFVAPYFFRSVESIRHHPRDPVVLLACKEAYRRVGFPDYDIFTKLMRRFCAEHGGGWRVEELAGKTHRQVAERMAESAFMVNLNSHEAFNSTVPEAMAAGCAVLCYEAVGGRDFLADGDNALVFGNHHVYALVERLQQLIRGGAGASDLLQLRLGGRATAARFTEAGTRRALAEAFAPLVAPRPVASG
jgi:glycosyltransferase involved in cell wall biosynthesis